MSIYQSIFNEMAKLMGIVGLQVVESRLKILLFIYFCYINMFLKNNFFNILL